MVAINYDVPEDLHHAVKVAAAQRGVTVKQFLIDALTDAVDTPQRRRKKG